MQLGLSCRATWNKRLGSLRHLGKEGIKNFKSIIQEEIFSLLVKFFSLDKNFMNDKPVLVDVRGMFNEEAAKGKGFYYETPLR